MLSEDTINKLDSKQLADLLNNLIEKTDYISCFIKAHSQKVWKLIRSSRDRTSLKSIRLKHGK